MTDGFNTYRYYIAVKLHFTSLRYNVFKTKGHVKGTIDTFNARNDRVLFERLGAQYSPKDLIQYIACNFMYGNDNVIYDTTLGESNYKEYIKRKQSITRVFENDIDYLMSNSVIDSDWRVDLPKITQLFLARKVTIETMSILNDFEQIVDQIKNNQSLALIFENDLLRIVKSKGFVKYDSDKINSRLLTFKSQEQVS